MDTISTSSKTTVEQEVTKVSSGGEVMHKPTVLKKQSLSNTATGPPNK